DADLVQTLTLAGNPDKTYSRISDSGLETIGAVSGGMPLEFTNPELMWPFPLEYGKAVSDDYEFLAEGVYYQQGEKKIEVDGYGTLITPAGTFPNTLRVKVVSGLGAVAGGRPIVTDTESYFWLNKDVKAEFLAQVVIATTSFTSGTG